ncbi:LuxR C-terminal-related transcriptional regulator [Ferrimonas sp. YFM]|uniref:LuxR C-terminal-related transcriptional regulator n=1 Tax=Ferrimonas sp. YFM TaxID=3028878 RepID=UPI002572892B|nr:LuxR C-terminal-related transcriptional regulator [Ferrimonas sp. YFM]BDY05134.1 hypothetical protein F0521_21750 [Ferrimonas sp. YFM]
MSTEWAKTFREKRLPTDLTEQLQLELRPFGVSHFYYTCFFSGEMIAGIASRKRSNDFSFESISSRTMERMHYIASPDPGFLRYLARYFHSYGDSDDWMKRPYQNEVVVVKQGRNRRIESATSELKINSTAFYDTRKNVQQVAGSYSLHSSMQTDAFENELNSQEGRIQTILERYHLAFMEAYPLELNPWMNLGIISGAAQKTLQLLAEGLPLEEVATSLFISKRGVDYHLEQLKVIMEAENRSHLIAKACAYGLIDFTPIRFRPGPTGQDPA